MRWYSVKKYRPPMDVSCLVFTEGNYLYVARLADSDDFVEWVADYECQDHGSYAEIIYDVTHFCIPDPIEIESEDILPCIRKIPVEKIQRVVDSVPKK